MSIREIIAAICIFIGLFVFLCSILGIYRFKYAMNRMHAAALGDTMGIFFVVLGLLILGQDISTWQNMPLSFCFSGYPVPFRHT